MVFERKTLVSQKVLDILASSDQPLSTAKILDCLKRQGIVPNRTTVYRILDKLVAAEEVKTIALKTGVSYYEMVKDKRHHHHFICTKCDDVFCLGGCHVKTFDIDLTKLLPNSSFSIQAHDFNLYGVCDKCGSP